LNLFSSLEFSLVAVMVLFAQPAAAEYRAFRLAISGPAGAGAQTIVSTLDPSQYANQHLAGRWESVVLEKSWMCYGRTSDYLPICPAPPDEGEVRPSQVPPVQ
jgi:hypothetical protein